MAGVIGGSCVTCHTPTGQPYLQALGDGFVVCTGGNGGGANTSGELGRIAAALALTGRWDSTLNPHEMTVVWEDRSDQPLP